VDELLGPVPSTESGASLLLTVSVEDADLGDPGRHRSPIPTGTCVKWRPTFPKEA
jgi:hypothetical protein